ncbi:MAG TPA: ABC transporter permease, partial [Verrucomicrobiae bacterium]|nr:ABC transporter permease [Verrucomicrobiae bacterium]
MRRDRLTFAMMLGIPMIQLILFGYAINSDPKHLPTAIYAADNSVFSRTIVWAMRNSSYFDITREPRNEAEIQQLLARGTVQFAVEIPVDFSRKLIRGEHPDLLLEADATDPMAIGYAVAAMNTLTTTVLSRDLTGPLAKLRNTPAPFNLVVHQHYNPENITQYNIVPGLMGVILTMTMVIITALAITRERESGTMENLLSTPLRPSEVIIGKIVPYIMVGYIQIFLILVAAKFLFNVPVVGSVPLLLVLAFLFIVAHLAVGVTFSTIARNQRQAMQMGMFFFLPNILLSGYMFPFRGMPGWAQDIGELLPLTHFLRVVRGILLKGNGLVEVAPDLWPIALFLV